MKKDIYIWLFGENEGTTSNNNAFFFWRQVVTRKDGIEKYLVLTKNASNLSRFRSLTEEERAHILWKNSQKHMRLFFRADLFLVSFSVRDILPNRLLGRPIRFRLKTPLVYLQHGTSAIKKLGFTGDSYQNHMLRFVYYNRAIREPIIEQNSFAPYQLLYGGFHPRYKEMARLMLAQKQEGGSPTGIAWFLTWREYLEDEAATEGFLHTIRCVLTDPQLIEYLNTRNEQLTLYIHHLFDKAAGAQLQAMQQQLGPRIRILRQNETDILHALVNSRLLITDYSSVGFDFACLGRPVLMFAPDLEEYLSRRKIYCDVQELTQAVIDDSGELVKRIVGEQHNIPLFYRSRLPETIDYEALQNGAHIERLYEELCRMQRRKITLLGWDFTVQNEENRTALELAERLLAQGYWVELLGLKQTSQKPLLPCGLCHNALYDADSGVPWQRLRRSRLWSRRHYGYLRFDAQMAEIAPYAGYRLRKELQRIRSAVVISTRESLHPFLQGATSSVIRQKWYAFFSPAATADDRYPGLCTEDNAGFWDTALFGDAYAKEQWQAQWKSAHWGRCAVITEDLSQFIEADSDSMG